MTIKREYGVPVQDSFIKMISDRNGYKAMIMYDYKTRNPKYVYERFSKDWKEDTEKSLVKMNRKDSKFYSESMVSVDHFKVR